jgi:hypothetical protein
LTVGVGAQSLGGLGGFGAQSTNGGGAGGAAGAGGNTLIYIDGGSIATTQYAAVGALAMSVGGAGGSGAAAAGTFTAMAATAASAATAPMRASSPRTISSKSSRRGATPMVQPMGGTLIVDANLAAGQADNITVKGSANIAGVIDIQPSVLANHAPTTVLTASDGVLLHAAVSTPMTAQSTVFSIATKVTGNSLQILFGKQCIYGERCRRLRSRRRA